MTYSIVSPSDVFNNGEMKRTSEVYPAPSDRFRIPLYCPLQVDCHHVEAEKYFLLSGSADQNIGHCSIKWWEPEHEVI